MSIYLMTLVFGFLSGLFINYLADCLPHHRRPTQPLCNACGKNLPVAAYLLFLQCDGCGKRRRLRTLSVYLFSFLIVSWLQVYPVRLDFWLSLLIYIIFGVITVIDIEYRAVLFETVVVSGLIFLAIGIARHGFLTTIIGGVTGFLIMAILYWLGKMILKLRYKASSIDEEALGFGDVNLFTILGLLLGFPAILVALWIAIFSAGLFSLAMVVFMILRKRYRSDLAIPYAPFLVFGAFVLLFLVPP